MPSPEELRQARMQQLMAQQQGQQQQAAQQQAYEQELTAKLQQLVSKILSPEAASRMGNLRAARPEFTKQVEMMLLQLYQAGQLPKEVSDAQLKEILKKVSAKPRETKITRR